MVQYTIPQSPEDILIQVPGRDSAKAREKAMDQLMELMGEGKLSTDLSDGFTPEEFIEVKEHKSDPSAEETAVVDAVQTLSSLANLKMKVQDSREEALKVRQLVDLLFTDETITDEQMEALKNGFKVLKSFAQTNLRYHDARSQAKAARQVLDDALGK
ncbi:MAG: hypothetical protein F6J97_17850 [Leptolyngbya sp. SIO4C1]|nr:hypothetical protein [Leptolyngbya sp. SIO4C1]